MFTTAFDKLSHGKHRYNSSEKSELDPLRKFPGHSVAPCRLCWRDEEREICSVTELITLVWDQLMPKGTLLGECFTNTYCRGVLQCTHSLCTHSKQCGGLSLTDVQHCHQKTAHFSMVWMLQINIPSHLKHLTYCQSWAGTTILSAIFLKQGFESTLPRLTVHRITESPRLEGILGVT